MQRVHIKDFAKTPDGVHHIQTQKPFCVNGQIWQGFNGAACKPPEHLLQTEELKAVVDIDGTIGEVWERRRKRLESRLTRKQREYDARRQELRKQRSALRESIKEDRELGLTENPADVDEIGRIDSRMLRLSDLNKQMELETSLIEEREAGPEGAVVEDSPALPIPEVEPEIVCEFCGEKPPPGHGQPKKWLVGHKMGAHKNPAQAQEATQAAAG